MSKRTSKPTIGPVEFIDRVIKLDEKGEPFTLAPYQRRVLERPCGMIHRASWHFGWLCSLSPRKAARPFWRHVWCSGGRALAITPKSSLVANDEEQATGRVFKTAVALIEHNQALKGECEIYMSQIRMNNGTTIMPISSDFKGAAGSRHSLVVFDEIWAFGQEKMQRAGALISFVCPFSFSALMI